MNPASQWRAAIARQLANLYIQNENIAVVMLGGSTARGHADQYSDLELGVFWQNDPTEADRQQVIDDMGADLIRLYPYKEAEALWSDAFSVGRNAVNERQSGLFVEIAHHRTDFIAQVIEDVTLNYSTNILSHGLLGGILDGVALYGQDLFAEWQKQASNYSHELAVAFVRQNSVIDHFWRWRMYLQRGENLMMLYQAWAQIQQQLLMILHGLNHVYYFGFKWLDVVDTRLTIKPANFVERLREVYQVPPPEGAALLEQLVVETLDLTEAHMPEVDIAWRRSVFHYQRPVWDKSPFMSDSDS